MSNESEEVIEFIEYHADLLLQKISEDFKNLKNRKILCYV